MDPDTYRTGRACFTRRTCRARRTGCARCARRTCGAGFTLRSRQPLRAYRSRQPLRPLSTCSTNGTCGTNGALFTLRPGGADRTGSTRCTRRADLTRRSCRTCRTLRPLRAYQRVERDARLICMAGISGGDEPRLSVRAIHAHGGGRLGLRLGLRAQQRGGRGGIGQREDSEVASDNGRR